MISGLARLNGKQAFGALFVVLGHIGLLGHFGLLGPFGLLGHFGFWGHFGLQGLFDGRAKVGKS